MQYKAIQISSDNGNINIKTLDNSYNGSLINVLNYLMQDNTVFLAWNLDEDIAHILKHLPKTSLQQLQSSNKTNYKGYKIFYITGKLFSISQATERYENFKSYNVYNLMQYYPYNSKPDSLEELEVLVDDLVSSLGSMGFRSSKLSSAVAIYEDQVLRNIDIPTLATARIPMYAAQYAYMCSGKLWIEAYKTGHFNNVFDYDINSAFPSIAKGLIDINGAEWIESEDYQNEADYGYCKGYVTIYDDVKVSPIIYQDNKGISSTPVGTWSTHLTKKEIDFLYQYKIGEFEIENGWWCFCKSKTKMPLRNIANRLLKYKESDNEIIRLLAKRMSVGGLYGKFGEEHKSTFGKHFNPVYFAEISSQCRLIVAKFIYDNNLEDSLIHISVDGVICTKQAKI